MSDKKPKAAGAKPAPAVVVPEPAPTPRERPVFDGETGMRLPPLDEERVALAAVIVPPVVVSSDVLRAALERIANGRLCGCLGMHDAEQWECPKTIAREVLK